MMGRGGPGGPRGCDLYMDMHADTAADFFFFLSHVCCEHHYQDV